MKSLAIIIKPIMAILVIWSIYYQFLNFIFGPLNLRQGSNWILQYSYIPHLWSIILLILFLIRVIVMEIPKERPVGVIDGSIKKFSIALFILLSIMSTIYQGFYFWTRIVPHVIVLSKTIPHVVTICICLRYVIHFTKHLLRREDG